MMANLYLSANESIAVPDFESAPHDIPPCFVISIRKSGSTMVTYAAKLVADAATLGFMDVGSALFYANIPADVLHTAEQINSLIRPGVIYSGFRDYPTIMKRSFSFRQAKKFILVRDPRDALVSEYFSNAFSHNIPDSGNTFSQSNTNLMSILRNEALSVDINDYVINRASDFVATASMFFGEISEANTLMIKYEDIIFDKASLINQMCSHFGISLELPVINRIAAIIDLRPTTEDPKAFVRKVTPGDHIEKLARPTKLKLDTLLSDVLVRFGYTSSDKR